MGPAVINNNRDQVLSVTLSVDGPYMHTHTCIYIHTYMHAHMYTYTGGREAHGQRGGGGGARGLERVEACGSIVRVYSVGVFSL